MSRVDRVAPSSTRRPIATSSSRRRARSPRSPTAIPPRRSSPSRARQSARRSRRWCPSRARQSAARASSRRPAASTCRRCRRASAPSAASFARASPRRSRGCASPSSRRPSRQRPSPPSPPAWRRSNPLQVVVPPDMAPPIYTWLRRLALQADIAGADRLMREAFVDLTSALSVSLVYSGGGRSAHARRQ